MCRGFLGCFACALFSLSVGTLLGIPLNDSFSNPHVLMGGSGSHPGDTRGGTVEPLEEPESAAESGNSVWFAWHASSGGVVDFSVSDAAFRYVIGVYSGAALGSLSRLGTAANGAVRVPLIPGTVYRVRVDGLSGDSGGFAIHWRQQFGAAGGPDLFVPENLIKLQLVEQNFDASACEVEERCLVQGLRRLLRFDMPTENLGREDLVFGPPENSPLFQFAPCHQHYHFAAFAAYRVVTLSNDVVRVGSKLGFCLEDSMNRTAPAESKPVYDCLHQGIQAGWADIYASGLPCQYIDVTALPEGDYFLEIELDPLKQIPESNEDNNLTRIPFHLPARCLAPPTNDFFATPMELVGDSLTVVEDTSCASSQTGELSHLRRHNGISLPFKSVWFRWTASQSGPVTISTEGSDFDTVLAVYNNVILQSLSANLIEDNDDLGVEGVKQSRLSFNAVAGKSYLILADSYYQGEGSQGGRDFDFGAQSGMLVLSVRPAANDDFDQCLSISGPKGIATGNLLSATVESGEPQHAGSLGGVSLWYCWTAPADGDYSFDTVGSGFDALLGVYRGNSVDALVALASDDDSAGYGAARVQFTATSGDSFSIAVDQKQGSSAQPSSGFVQLHWYGPGSAEAPRVVTQPRSVTALIGTNVVISVSVSGSGPLVYEWEHNGIRVQDSDRVTGSGTATLKVKDVVSEDRGVYQVTVSNQAGSVKSDRVSLVAAVPSRVVYVLPTESRPLAGVSVPIWINARDGEHDLRFSIVFDPSHLRNATVQPAATLPTGSVIAIDSSLSLFGEFGISIRLPEGAGLAPGTHLLASLEGTLTSLIQPEQRLSVCFGDEPEARKILGLDSTPLGTLYACGDVILQGGGAGEILVGGWNDSGKFTLSLHGTPGATYDFQRSTDLQHWVTFSTQLSLQAELMVEDAATPGPNFAFYRTVRR